MQVRDRARHEALNRLTQEVQKAGLYDKVYLPKEWTQARRRDSFERSTWYRSRSLKT